MSYDFNADEIFKMAEQMERNGGRFYRDAAKSLSEDSAKALLLKLAAMEDDHVKTFTGMRENLSAGEKGPTVFDPDGESALYLRALADTRVFFEKEVDTSTLENILKAAIGAEKDSIVFYLGMKELVPETHGKAKMDAIIKEEMQHIRLLSRELSALRK